MEGGGDVCPQPTGSARSRPVMSANRGGMKRARGARSSARKRLRSLMPRARMASVNWARSSDSATVMTGPYPANVVSIASTTGKRLLKPQTRIVIGEIEPERGDRNLFGRQRRKVGSLRLLVSAALEHEPEVGKAAAVASLLPPHQFGVAPSLAGERNSRHLGRRAGRKVDVDEAARSDAGGQNRANDRRGMRFRRLPFDLRPSNRAAIGLRQGDRGNAQERPFHRTGDRARVGDILGDVLAAVDA